MAWRQGDAGRAAVLATEAVALTRELGDRPALADALGFLGMAAYWRGNDTAARAFAAEALALARAAGDRSDPGERGSCDMAGFWSASVGTRTDARGSRRAWPCSATLGDR